MMGIDSFVFFVIRVLDIFYFIYYYLTNYSMEHDEENNEEIMLESKKRID